MRDTSFESLDPRFRPLARQLVANVEARGVPVRVINTGRTDAEHAEDLAHGVSWIKRSPHQDGLAIDLAPAAVLKMKNWAPASPLWWVIAEEAVKLGLRSGMDWKGVGLPPVGTVRAEWDPGHVEWKT